MKALFFSILMASAFAHPLFSQERGASSQGQATSASSGQAAVDPVAAKLNSIVLPELNIHELSLYRAIDQLCVLSQSYDKDSGGVNMVVIDPDRRNPTVSIALRNIQLGKALDLITKQAGFAYRITGGVVEIRPDGGRRAAPALPQEDASRSTRGPAADPVIEKLNAIILPEVNIRDMSLSRVIGQLRALSQAYDKEAKGVNMVLIDPDRKDPKVNIALRNMPMGKLLEIVTKQVEFTYEIKNGVVEVRPDAGSKDIETAFFQFPPSSLVRMTGYRGAIGQSPNNDPLAVRPEEVALYNFFNRSGVSFETTPGTALAYDGTYLIVSQNSQNLERVRAIMRRYAGIEVRLPR
jgi:DNA-directed RNA polymerase subunit K/omega